LATAKKTVVPTISKYSIVDRATGNRENIKDVRTTFFHNGIVELWIIDGSILTYELAAIEIEKY
jgi:hypothetical protein